MQLDFLINLMYLTHFGQNWTYVVYRKPSSKLELVKRFWKFSILTKFWELFGFLAHLEVTKIWDYFFWAKKLIFQYIKHPYKRPNFGREEACPKDIPESYRRGYADNSWSLFVWRPKKVDIFFQHVYGPLYCSGTSC